ncbi:MAG: hypothetical protein NTV23_00465 [Propionibacteriales bacterium]|nr:hypothetical protein [Propionibacteriales bacterium]
MGTRTRTSVLAAVLLGAAVTTAACGNDGSTVKAAAADPETLAQPDAGWGERPWLLRFSTAGGPEGETVQAVYVRFTPDTGATTVRSLPALDNRDTYADSQALLVSADQQYALLDSRVTAADRAAGRVTVFPIDGDGSVRLDVRSWSGSPDLKPVGVAFDPVDGALLRVVDARQQVWKVDVTARTAVRDGNLPQHPGWIFANGFDKNTGLPFIESLDTPDTLPAGNGDDDVRPVERRGGVLRPTDPNDVAGQPALPCGFAGGFTLTDGAAWLFCADTPKISAYRWTPGADAWEQVGVASKAVVPRTAEELPVVLPPVGTD